MKVFKKWLSLLLVSEFILGTFGPSLFLVTSALAVDCPTGMTFNSSLNRCLTNAEVVAVNQAVASCSSISDVATQQACYQTNAQAALQSQLDQGNVKGNDSFVKDQGYLKTGAIAGNAAAISVPLFLLIKTMAHQAKLKDKGFKCNPPSLILMFTAAGVLGLGEVITYFNHRKKLDDLQAQWKTIVTPDATATEEDKKAQATEAQSQAFEMLAQNEDSTAKLAKTKFAYYMAATGLFAAGMLAATLEQIQLGVAKAQMTVPATAAQGAATQSRLTCYTRTPTEAERKMIEEGEKLKGNSAPVDSLLNDKIDFQTPVTHNWNSKDFILKAAYSNLRSAKNAEELYQLLKEIDAMNFENYSQVSYIDQDFSQELKKYSFDPIVSQVITQIFVDEAHAEDPASNPIANSPTDATTTEDKQGFLAKMGGTLFGGLQTISGVIKFKGGAPITATDLTFVEDKMKSDFSKAVYSPVTRIAVNGVLGGWMGVMSAHMKSQQKISEARAVKLREIKEDFNYQSGLMTCTSVERSDPANPPCYCYTSDGQRNPARTNSSICQSFWNGPNLTAGTYLGSPTSLVCVDVNTGMDPSCSCKQTKTCMQAGISSFNLSGINPGFFKMLNVGAGAGNGLLNGTLGAGQIDGASIGANAARIKSAANDLLLKTDPNAAKDVAKASSGLEDSLMASGSGLSMGDSGSGSSLASLSPQQAVAELEKELKEDETPEVTTSGGNSPTGPGNTAPVEQLEFGMTENQLAAQQEALAGVMNKKMDYGQNDINNSTSNIFDLLSNRYQRSGMRRLFDGEGKVEADKPAKSDINK